MCVGGGVWCVKVCVVGGVGWVVDLDPRVRDLPVDEGDRVRLLMLRFCSKEGLTLFKMA